MALCVEMLISGKLAKDDAEARAKLQAVLDNGKAAEVFGRMVAAQKGPTDFVENYAKYLPTAMLTKAVYADTEGFVSEMDTRALGMAVVAMGGGRRQASDTIDYSVGFTDIGASGRPGRRSASAGGYPRERRKPLAGSGESGESGN